MSGYEKPYDGGVSGVLPFVGEVTRLPAIEMGMVMFQAGCENGGIIRVGFGDPVFELEAGDIIPCIPLGHLDALSYICDVEGDVLIYMGLR